MIKDMSLITEKLFRNRENEKKVEFIIQNTDLTFEFIQKASVLSRQNEYHNFGHELGSAEQGIRIAIAEGKSRQEINLIAATLLVHDGGHTGIVRWYDEIHSVDLMRTAFSSTDTQIMGLS